MRVAKPALLAATVVLCGCSTLLPLAAKAAAAYFFPFLLLVSADTPSPEGPDQGANDGLMLALDRARNPGEEGLPSGWVVLDDLVEDAAGEKIVAYAIPVEADSAPHEARLEELRRRHGAVRVVAFDARPMVDDPERTRDRLAALESAGVLVRAEGRLGAIQTE